jgi:hypothetical protein
MYKNSPHLAERNNRKIEELKVLETSLESKCKIKYIDDNNNYSFSDRKKLLKFLVHKLKINYRLNFNDAGVYWELSATRCELRIRNALGHYFNGEELLDTEKEYIKKYIQINRCEIFDGPEAPEKLSHAIIMKYASGNYSTFERAAMDEIYDTIVKPENAETRSRLI